jgi:hypothetical protein
MTTPLDAYGRAEALQTRMGVDLETAQRLAGVIIFAAHIEQKLEEAIWHLRGDQPRGVRPDTDAKQVSELLNMLTGIASAMPDGPEAGMLTTWCTAMRSGIVVRNNLVHGIPVNVGGAVAFLQNPSWHGVVRKRPPSDLWVDENTLALIREAFAVLLRVITAVERGDRDLPKNDSAMRALRDARSVLGELSDKTYNPSFEKY